MSLAEGQGWLWLVLPQWMVMGIPWFLFVFHGAKCSSQSRQKKRQISAELCKRQQRHERIFLQTSYQQSSPNLSKGEVGLFQ